MPLHGFGKLAIPSWSRAEKKRMRKYISDKSSDWKKKSLAWARLEIKTSGLVSQVFRCAYCRVLISDRLGMVEIDHVISKDHVPKFLYLRCNLVLTCKRCNNNKGNKNPTKYSLFNLTKRKRYPLDADKYNWVHPYLHDYDDHIEISEGYIFSAKSGSPNGLALIKGCGLHKLSVVSKRQRMAVILGAARDVDAVMAVVGGFPLVSDGDLAAELSIKPGISLNVAELEELISRIRGGSLKNLLGSMRGI